MLILTIQVQVVKELILVNIKLILTDFFKRKHVSYA